MRRSSLWPWVLAAVAVVLAVSAFVLDALAGSHGDGWWLNVLAASAFAATAGVGLLVAVRRPGHPIGWLLQATAILLAAAGAAAGYADYSILEEPGALPGAEWAVLWDESAWPLLFGTLIAIVLVFPDGRLPSPRWRRAMIGAAAAFALLVILGLFDSEPFEAPYEKVDRPLPGLPGAFEVLWPVAFLGVLASLVAGVQAVRVRFRRARGIERLQLKWLTFTAALVPATLLICLAGSLLGGNSDGDAFNALFFFMLGAIPASIGVAVLRYRLYDIDVVINRTLVYGVAHGAARGGVRRDHAAARHRARERLGLGDGRRDARSLRWRSARCAQRVQDVVDRRFSRARYDAPTPNRRRSSRTFAPAVPHPRRSSRVLREVLADPAPRAALLPARERALRGRARPARLTTARTTARLRTPVERAGAAARHACFTARSAAEDRPACWTRSSRPPAWRSRSRACASSCAASSTRSRPRGRGSSPRATRSAAGIERDLHDGAQQRLVSIGLALRHAQHELGVAPDGRARRSRPRFRRSPSRSRSCASSREGCGPPSSTRASRPRSRARRPRAAAGRGARPAGERYPQAIEAAAYFIACEGLTNVVKHAEARHAVR